MKIAGRVRLNPTSNGQLKNLYDKRMEEGSAIASRTAIIADLIAKAHKRECK